LELALIPGQVEGAQRLMQKHSPPRCPDQELNRDTRTMGCQSECALPVAHAVGGSPAIELRSTLPKPEDVPLTQEKRQLARRGIGNEFLNQAAGAGFDADG
jgi:hypothetical protein